ncbi:phosphonate degradation HD-domain oxygenase [Cecembia calidifontis]|jgi:phosphonate degradation associated HDIG domain protein|uniref:Phosphonate degradation associated HDIG domain protein n=1 Tax=Cecembia calidifontis TaxID=1187080 RepID=A0A4Q7PDZ3_9BACT|nr:phosphonate degradation HD-domain oxygenase [Cecembia calidifontis]RZS97850.1 phosphonate degradation associated HDIG domain protein [Cecembia calidifontis]
MKSELFEISNKVNEVFALYEKHGKEDYIGEPVSQIEHMCQSAQLAESEGYDKEVILASFFHDIGHLFALDKQIENMGGFGAVRHELLGADYLRAKGFSEKIARLVENHVQAKRYLTYKFPEYYSKLSEASKKTLEYQGGVMSPQEAEAFENNEYFELSLKMRTWDEMAKEENIPIPDLSKYKKLALEIISQG